MKAASIVVFAVCVFLLALSFAHVVYGQNDAVVYKVQINTDKSATWIITKVQDTNGTIDTWEGFQQKIISVVAQAADLNQRQMAVDVNSLQMATTISQETQSKTTEYEFTWLNFTLNQTGQLIFGDVFTTPYFFNQLYGDGSLQIVYPSSYVVEKVMPSPNQQENASYIMTWIRTQDFVNGKPNLILIAASTLPNADLNFDLNLGFNYFLIGLGIAGIVVAVSGSIYYVVKRRKSRTEIEKLPKISSQTRMALLETEEEKVIKVLQANGGSMFQSAITEQCRFSKAKTSQLLTALEQKGVVGRYKKGRDKIVAIANQAKRA